MNKTILKWLRAFYTTVLYLITSLMAIALLVASAMSCFATTGRLCELSCHLMTLYLGAAVVGLFLIGLDSLIMRRRLLVAKLGAVSMMMVLVYCSCRVIPLWLRDDKAPSSVQMTLLHLNLAGERNKDYKTFLGQIAKENPDIVLVSESTPVWADALSENLKSKYPYFDKGFKSELAIYSKYPIVLSEIKEIVFIERKRLLTKVVHPVLGPVTILLVHPVIPLWDESLAARNEELELYPKDLKGFDTPHILVGDLNCTRWSPYFDKLLKEGELKNSENGFGYNPTWPDVAIKPVLTIDHVLVSKELSIKERRNLANAGSDHLPVLVKLGLVEPLTASVAPITEHTAGAAPATGATPATYMSDSPKVK